MNSVLRARGTMLLLFDVAAGAVAEHDDWHTHEHMPERLAIPGFLRGTRWTRAVAGPRYCVLYEVDTPAVLDSPAYRARLDNPTPWTAKMVSHYLGTRRTLCEVKDGDGDGIGSACLVVTFAPAQGRNDQLRERLVETLRPLAARRGLSAWRWLENALPAAMTREQSIRGRDGVVDSALWITGYDVDAVASLAEAEFGAQRMHEFGVVAVDRAVFRLAYSLSASDV
jgi:hypothetical protein